MNVMNAELCKRAAEKVGNPNVLVNLVSRRVRQFNSGGGGLSRPLIENYGNWAWPTSRCAKLLRTKSAGICRRSSELVRPLPKKRKKNKAERRMKNEE